MEKTSKINKRTRMFIPDSRVPYCLCYVMLYVRYVGQWAVKLIHTTLDDNVVISLNNFLF